MRITIKAIKHSPSLSQETLAFTANVYINNKKAGYASNTGIGGPTEVRVEPQWKEVVEQFACAWLDELQPHPEDYVLDKTVNNGKPQFVRINASAREAKSPESDLEACVDVLLANHLMIKDVKKAKTKYSFITKNSKRGEYSYFGNTKQPLGERYVVETEAREDFICWLYTLEPSEIAVKIGIRDEQDGPLVVYAGSLK